MTQYYLYVENNEIFSSGYRPMGDSFISIEVPKELHDDYCIHRNKYKYDNGNIVINPNYEQEEAEKRRVQFYLDFFQTSLGFIRRKPILANGTEDDFLNNDLPLLAIGLMTGANPVLPIAYQLPDFTHELTQEYMESLQIKNQPITQQFIAECSAVKMKDFTG